MALNDDGDPAAAGGDGWLLTQVAPDPFALGLLGQTELVPHIGVALFASYVVDRTDRRLASVPSLAILLARIGRSRAPLRHGDLGRPFVA